MEDRSAKCSSRKCQLHGTFSKIIALGIIIVLTSTHLYTMYLNCHSPIALLLQIRKGIVGRSLIWRRMANGNFDVVLAKPIKILATNMALKPCSTVQSWSSGPSSSTNSVYLFPSYDFHSFSFVGFFFLVASRMLTIEILRSFFFQGIASVIGNLVTWQFLCEILSMCWWAATKLLSHNCQAFVDASAFSYTSQKDLMFTIT